MIIINADDWGGWRSATEAARRCHAQGRLSSVSGMVFMADSERAAEIAGAEGVSVGLHVNFSQEFTGSACPASVRQQHQRICRFLKPSRYALLLYHPVLQSAFADVYRAQHDEFLRLYGHEPVHVDGHQHMHLCTNLLLQPVIPAGLRVRRSFSFWPGEKSWLNRRYRRWVDTRLARRYRLTDYFFSLGQCLERTRLARVLQLAETKSVELMTHPEYETEFEWLMKDTACQAIALKSA